jgi:hypothetical protein
MFDLRHTPVIRAICILACVAASPLIVSACGLDTDSMVPEAPSQSANAIGHSVRVMDVALESKTEFSIWETQPTAVDSDQFREALMRALKKANLFSDVSVDHGDIDLYAAIRLQSQTGMLPVTSKLLVTYKFTDTSGNTIWTTSYESESSSNAISGLERVSNAREGSVRENLAALVKGIQQHWPQGK